MLNKKSIGLVLTILLLAILFFVLRSCESDKSTTPEPTNTASPTPSSKPKAESHSTGYIVRKIEKKLESNSDLDLNLDCPKKVALKHGEKFECDVMKSQDPEDVLAVVHVTIEDSTGYFTWKSVANK